MKNILIIQNGSVVDVMLTTSLLQRLKKDGHNLHIATNSVGVNILGHGFIKNIDRLPYLNPLPFYDLAVNLNPDPLGGTALNKVNASEKRGFGYSDKLLFLDKPSDLYYRARYLGIPTENNIFQLMFGIFDIAWQGEGYSLNYFPKTRQSKKITGILIRDSKLRNYIHENLSVKDQILRSVPFKNEILKQIDEINRCKRLVTDDEGCMHLGLALHKHVEYIIRKKPVYKVELFGHGNMHIIERKFSEI